MENEPEDSAAGNSSNNSSLIDSFCEVTRTSKEEAGFFLESHNWDLDLAVPAFFETLSVPETASIISKTFDLPPRSRSRSPSQSYSPSRSRSTSRSRSSSPSGQSRAPYELRSRGKKNKKRKIDGQSSSRTRGGTRTRADLNQTVGDDSDSDSDEPEEFFSGGEKSDMPVHDPTKGNDVESIFSQARRSGARERLPQESSSSRSLTGTRRLRSGETLASPESMDGPLQGLDDPENASLLESIKRYEVPKELKPAEIGKEVRVNHMRRDGPYKDPKNGRPPFRGTGRTIGTTASSDAAAASAAEPMTQQPSPLMGLNVDSSLPSTSIQLRLADGTRMVSRFNLTHTIRDVRSFIGASRPGGPENYQLLTMGFPLKQLTNLDQTIEEAGVANSVVIQKL